MSVWTLCILLAAKPSVGLVQRPPCPLPCWELAVQQLQFKLSLQYLVAEVTKAFKAKGQGLCPSFLCSQVIRKTLQGCLSTLYFLFTVQRCDHESEVRSLWLDQCCLQVWGVLH